MKLFLSWGGPRSKDWLTMRDRKVNPRRDCIIVQIFFKSPIPSPGSASVRVVGMPFLARPEFAANWAQRCQYMMTPPRLPKGEPVTHRGEIGRSLQV